MRFIRYIWSLITLAGIDITPEKKARFRTGLSGIFVTHILGVAMAIWAARAWYTGANKDTAAAIFMFLGGLNIVIGLWILLVSTYNEVLLRQSYEFAANTSHSAIHRFNNFQEHLLWLKTYLPPGQFPKKNGRLFLTLSTALYGIADGEASADAFLEYLESWIACFEQLPPDNPYRPQWELAVWSAEDNRKTFASGISNKFTAEAKIKVIKRYAGLCRRIYRLSELKQVAVRLYFTDRSDVRLFMVEYDHNKSCGLVVTFTPLSISAIKLNRWFMVGFSFKDHEGFKNSLIQRPPPAPGA